MRYLPHMLVAACLASGKATADTPATEIMFGSSRGLTVFKVTFARSRLGDDTSSFPSIDHWHAAVLAGAARQVHLGFDFEQPAVVAVYGLVDEVQSLKLRIAPVAGPSLSSAAFVVDVDREAANQHDGAALLAQWSAARRWDSLPYPPRRSTGGLLRPMLMRSAHLYEPRVSRNEFFPEGERRGRRARFSNAFSLLSGEAAAQETLQQQLLEAPERGGAPAHDVRTLAGPAVPSHPFGQMLGRREVQTPAIASLVPHDRYLVHVDDIGAALGWLDQAAASGFELVGLKLGSHVGHDLVERYLSRLHFSRGLVERLARTGVIHEAALFGPDLYLKHGSDLTVVLDTPGSGALGLLLAPLLGALPGADPGAVIRYGDGPHPAYFAHHGQWLIFSTSEREASAALTLAINDGAGSLGRSEEFRYMLALLPPEDGAKGPFVYFSDPFIRSMVGPATKIGQLRRHRARARLNLVVAGQALHELDRGEAADLETLVSLGYVERAWLSAPEGDRLGIDEDGTIRSSLYGTLDDMVPLGRLDLAYVTDAEKQGYERYVAEYSSFWSQFFDPIGVRIDVTDVLRVETVILPLIENSIYTRLRDLIGGAPGTLRVPRYTPEPVTTLSFKLPPVEAIPPFAKLRDLAGGEPIFGEAVHIAIYDSSPLIALGSVDLAGGFSGAWLAGNRNWMLWGGLLGSMLTQPTTIFLELAPGFARSSKVEIALNDALFQWFRPEVGRHRLDRVDDDEWVFTWTLEGLLRVHAYLSLVDDYLVISNRRTPLTPAPEGPETVSANAAVHVRFDEIDDLASLLGLHQLQHAQDSALAGAERLRPFFMLGAVDLDAAMDDHERLYGTRPVPPAGSRWHWNTGTRHLDNDRFGDPFEARLPPGWVGSQGGPFAGLRSLRLDFRFVEEGIRTVLRVE